MYTVKEIQTRLNLEGYNSGPPDGFIGRKTIQAIKAFQVDHALQVDGIPGTFTLASLFKTSADSVKADKETKLLTMPWLDLAISKKGLSENADNTELRKFLRSDGSTVGDPAQLPWCGDFVETCIALTLTSEILPVNPYLARNWEKFGREVHPTLGAVGVFWRGDRNGIQGHVAFLVGTGAGVYYILGGNQSNRISVMKIAMTRLLSARWPTTVALPSVFKLPNMKNGVLSLNEA